MLVHRRDQYGNDVVLLTKAGIVIAGRNTYYAPHVKTRSANGVMRRVELTRNQFDANVECLEDRGGSVLVCELFVVLPTFTGLDRNVHLPRAFIAVQRFMRRCMRMRLFRIRALSLAMGHHPRLGEHSLVRTLPADLVNRIALLV